MLIPAGYSGAELIQDRKDHQIYRVISEEDDQPYLLKKAVGEQQFGKIAQSKILHEYKLLQKITSKGVLKPVDFSNNEQDSFIVFSNFEGVWLEDLIRQARFDISGLIRFAIRICQTIGELHKDHIIHNGLNPRDILVNMKSGDLRLCNFGNASLINFVNSESYTNIKADWQLPYISPEQTGRMNRTVDYRSDYYTIGIILYEMLLGYTPFDTKDPLEMVHCHIARIPVAPAIKNSALPEMVSEIIMKLLSKNAEDRYQSAAGIVFDLERCLNEWQKNKSISVFEPGKNDHYDILSIPEKLYGREQEIEKLTTLFEQTAAGACRFVTINGFSGIGKTALVQEIYKPLTKYKGYFISGKFDQLNRNIPYLSILSAFSSLMKQILSEPQSSLENIKNELKKVLGQNARLITDVVPELEFIIGPQESVQQLPPGESLNRFNNTFRDFITFFARKDHPLVFFLDDVQWADIASMNFIRKLVEESPDSSLLIICAYRDNLIDKSHPFYKILEDLRQKKLIHYETKLTALSAGDVRNMIDETLHSSSGKTGSLAELIYEKTQGNPFFVRQFLKTLFENGLIKYQKGSPQDKYTWQWDIARIKKLGITENVVQLLTDKLDKLPEESRKVMQMAACIGNDFDLHTLSIICEINIIKTANFLWLPLRQGLIIADNEDFKYFLDAETDQGFDTLDSSVTYHFLHDRVQQAAYLTIPDEKREATHYKIGNLLLKNTSEKNLDDEIFDILHHLNQGISQIKDTSERIKLAGLNMTAGRKAKNSAAFESAYKYFKTGTDLLPQDSWNKNYPLFWSLFTELSEAEYITNNFDDAEQHFELVIKNSRSDIEKVQIYTTKVKLYTHINKVKEALETGIQAAALLGWNIPAHPSRSRVAFEFLKVRMQLTNKKIAQLKNLPEMQNEAAKNAISLISQMSTSAYFTGPEMIGLLNLLMMQIVMKYGNPESASFVYSQYALLEGAGAGAYQRAYNLGAQALAFSQEHNLPYWKCKTYLTLGAIINHWRKPMQSNIPILEEGYLAAIESGDLLYSLYCNSFMVHTKISMGTEISALLKEIERYIDYSKKIRRSNFDLVLYRRMLIELQDDNEKLSGESFDEKQFLQDIRNAKDLSAEILFYINSIKTAFFNQHYSLAVEKSIEAEYVLQGAFGQLMELEYRFYTALSIAHVLQNKNIHFPHNLKKRFSAHVSKIKKWADNSAENFQQHLFLLQAEAAAIKGEAASCANLYEKAISTAVENKFYHIAAIACEQGAKYYLRLKQPRVAVTYISDSLKYYGNWGVLKKTNHLFNEYRNLLENFDVLKFGPPGIKSENPQNDISSALDMDTVLRASQALSSEIRLSKLIQTIMSVAIANAGAEKGLFIMENNDQLFIQGEGNSENPDYPVMQNIALDNHPGIAHSVIRYVRRTLKHVLLNDAQKDENFMNDPYIIHKKVRSLLCIPVLNKNVLKGILYLENNLTDNAFTQDRIELLNMLSSEMSVSIENAQLYEKLAQANRQLEEYSKSLEVKVQERTQDLQTRTNELEKTNRQLENVLENLQKTQNQLIHAEKMASLGELTAGIAHEIKNPLNFVNNFSEVTVELLQELQENLDKINEKISPEILEDNTLLMTDIQSNLSKITHHGKRADSIIHSMMQHARGSSGQKEATDINTLLEESVNLVYHGMRAQDSTFNIDITKQLDPQAGSINIVPQNISRVLLNIINNGCFAAYEKHRENRKENATLLVSSEKKQDYVEIRIKDNGAGIPKDSIKKIFNPFFTTKPTGKGTGLGLSISYDIITKEHNGSISVNSEPGKYCEFVINLPK
ncbi:MAG: AAA family ATPase [Calditrichae bacterium]|nr:AAA family ATPase [Calditrichia bacterium]